MKLVDANVLLYAVDQDAPHHAEARAWLDGALAGRETVGLPWLVLLAFLRLSTNPAVFPTPLSVGQALDVLESWLSHPGVLVPEPTARHLAVLRGLLAPLGTAANLVADAHLAALAVELDAEVVSYDRDFARFPGLRHALPG